MGTKKPTSVGVDEGLSASGTFHVLEWNLAIGAMLNGSRVVGALAFATRLRFLGLLLATRPIFAIAAFGFFHQETFFT